MEENEIITVVEMYKALQVIRLDPAISSYLENNDPKAYKQVIEAIMDAELNINGMKFLCRPTSPKE